MSSGYIGNNNAASKINGIYIGVDNVARKVSKVYVGINNVAQLAYSEGTTVDYLTFTSVTENAELSMTTVGYTDAYVIPSLQYSYNKGSWKTFTPGTTSITFKNVGDNVRIRAKSTNAAFSYSASIYSTFVMNGDFNCSGSIMYLLDKTGKQSTISQEYCFHNLFKNCVGLLSAPTLPVITLPKACYSYMFYGCSALTVAPDLPANSLSSYAYQYMFAGSGIIETPKLSASTLPTYVYYHMFDGCTSLITANEIEATKCEGDNNVSHCMEQMFTKCTNLKTVKSNIMIGVLDYACSYMFADCTSLENAPTIEGSYVRNYGCEGMFYGCTALKSYNKALSFTMLGEGCCSYMFSGCSSMESIPAITNNYIFPDKALWNAFSYTGLYIYKSETSVYKNEYAIPMNKIGIKSESYSFLMMFSSDSSYSSVMKPELNTAYYTDKPVIT